MTKDHWDRVSKRLPCPQCGHDHWCLIAKDKSAAICPRTPSDKRAGEAGWLHILANDRRVWIARPYRIAIDTNSVRDLSQLAARYQVVGEETGKLVQLALMLKVSAKSLRRLGVGWSRGQECWTFPLRDSTGLKVLGISRRFSDGAKYVMRGHKAGLYLPRDLPTDLSSTTLLIVEGGSDAAAALDLEFWAVGRFSCTHGSRLTAHGATGASGFAAGAAAAAAPPPLSPRMWPMM